MSSSFVSLIGSEDLTDVDLAFTVNGKEHLPATTPHQEGEKTTDKLDNNP